jgi:hypothetical protein
MERGFATAKNFRTELFSILPAVESRSHGLSEESREICKPSHEVVRSSEMFCAGYS